MYEKRHVILYRVQKLNDLISANKHLISANKHLIKC